MKKPWTTAELRTLLQLAGSGISYREIGATLGRSYASVTQRIYQHRVARGQRMAPPWTIGDERRLLRLVGSGATAKEAARSLGRTPQAVYSRLCKIRKRA